MGEIGIDISHNETQAVFDIIKAGRLFAFVITDCDETNAEWCPVFAGITKRADLGSVSKFEAMGVEALCSLCKSIAFASIWTSYAAIGLVLVVSALLRDGSGTIRPTGGC